MFHTVCFKTIEYVIVKYIHNAAFYSQVWFLICQVKFFRSQELHYVA